VRDVLADNSPNTPTDYGYGSDGTAVAESDTALGNELVSVLLDEILIQNANITSQWESVIDDLSTAYRIDDALEPAQINYVEIPSSLDGTTFAVVDDFYVGGSARSLTGSDSFLEFEITPDKTIPAENVQIAVRLDTANDSTDVSSDGALPFEASLDGFLFNELTDVAAGANLSLSWRNLVGEGFNPQGAIPFDLEAGEAYTLRFDGTFDSTDTLFTVFDTIALFNDEYEADLTFDNTLDQPNGNLDGPELFADAPVQSFNTAPTRRNVTEAAFEATINNTTEGQYVELANDGSTFTRVNNSETGSVTFAAPDRDVDVNVVLDRYGGPRNDTPRFGYLRQTMSDWQLTANPDAVTQDDIGVTIARAIVAPNTIDGETVREAGLQNGSTLLTRHELAEAQILTDQRLASAETTRFNGTN